ncbi:alpha-lytic protease prodomain-containing protein, partial [Streptomyces sp. E11-3]|uniref:alpha-lytic protease prodomain-containing protein n=1 Tax=Streptomyces sp. E11-3 TaxID=3110112 RepID=UPI00397F3724
MPAISRAARRIAAASSAAVAVMIPAAPATAADDPVKPLTEPARAAALADDLGDTRSGGVYHEDGKLVVTVTDQAAARTVRATGGTPKLVVRSTAQLKGVLHDLDELENLPNTAWGIDPRTNQVSVDIFDGAPADSQERIEKSTAGDPGAVRIDRFKGEIAPKATDLRGGNRIRWRSAGGGCTAGFNTKDSKGRIYTLTAGHCAVGTGYGWYMDWNYADIGTQTAYGYGGTKGDWAM